MQNFQGKSALDAEIGRSASPSRRKVLRLLGELSLLQNLDLYEEKSRTFFSLDRKEKIFPYLPAPVRETRGWVVPRILHGFISVASLLSSDDVDRFLELASRGGCLVGNT